MSFAVGIISINLAAIKSNWLMLAKAVNSGCTCGAVVKADAYGLGAPAVVQALYSAGCRHFFVAQADEALALRRILPMSSCIYVFQGVRAGEEPLFLERQLIPVLLSVPMIERWQKAVRNNPVAPCVIKVDTGMNRFGVSEAEMRSLLAGGAKSLPSGLISIMSHLACADTPKHPLNQTQLQRFEKIHNEVREFRPGVGGSLANSAGVYLGDDWCFSLVRPGIALYGGGFDGHPDMAPESVVSVSVAVVQVKVVEAGEAVGYGAEFRASKPLVVAVVAAGYADGFSRAMAGAGHAWFGQLLPLLGRVSMDSMVFDISALPERERPKEGDLLELMGANISLNQVAEWSDTSSYEVLTRLGGRLSKKYVEGPE